MTPLHFAAMGNHLRVASYLMSKGASSRIENTVGQTAADLSSSPEMDAIIKANRVRKQIASAIREEARAKEEANRKAMLTYVKENWYDLFVAGMTHETLPYSSTQRFDQCIHLSQVLLPWNHCCPYSRCRAERATARREGKEEEEDESENYTRAKVHEDTNAQHFGHSREQ